MLLFLLLSTATMVTEDMSSGSDPKTFRIGSTYFAVSTRTPIGMRPGQLAIL